MTAFIKKQGPAFYFNILSAAAGIVAFVAMVVSSTMNDARLERILCQCGFHCLLCDLHRAADYRFILKEC